MAEVGRDVDNTIGKPEITFAMIELADSADCNARRRIWKGYSFKDVTPMFSGRGQVPSLNDGMVADGRQMIQQMQSINADWFMLSGHHGCLYESDYDSFKTNGQIDTLSCANGMDFCGFFNEAYHAGRWEYATRADPDALLNDPDDGPKMAKNHANEIYLRTTPAAPSTVAKHTQTNPLLDGTPDQATSRSGQCKGIIISACNTLIYRAARDTWATAFPNAVIIGSVSRIVSGTWITNAIASAKMTNENFWRDPQSILDQPGMCEQLRGQLQAGFPSSATIGLIYKKTLFVAGRSQAAGDPLT